MPSTIRGPGPVRSRPAPRRRPDRDEPPLSRARTPAAPAAATGPVSAGRVSPTGAKMSISGSTSRIASQLVGGAGSTSRPRRSQPPERRTCSGTQRPLASKGGRGPGGRRRAWRRRPWSWRTSDLLLDLAPALSQLLHQLDRIVLGLGHGADRGDRVEDALDARRVQDTTIWRASRLAGPASRTLAADVAAAGGIVPHQHEIRSTRPSRAAVRIQLRGDPISFAR